MKYISSVFVLTRDLIILDGRRGVIGVCTLRGCTRCIFTRTSVSTKWTCVYEFESVYLPR